MKLACAVALLFLLVAPGVGSAAEPEQDLPDRPKLGEFLPSSQPFPAPAISLTDAAGNTEGAAEWASPKILGVLEPLLSDNSVVKASSR